MTKSVPKGSALNDFSLSIRLLQHAPICIRSYAKSQAHQTVIARRYVLATFANNRFRLRTLAAESRPIVGLVRRPRHLQFLLECLKLNHSSIFALDCVCVEILRKIRPLDDTGRLLGFRLLF